MRAFRMGCQPSPFAQLSQRRGGWAGMVLWDWRRSFPTATRLAPLVETLFNGDEIGAASATNDATFGVGGE